LSLANTVALIIEDLVLPTLNDTVHSAF